MLNFKKGDVEKFTKIPNEHVAVTNIKRSLLAQQFDLTPSRLRETESNLIQVGAPIDVNMPYYSVMEQSLHGRCLSNYNVNPLNDARALELEQEWMSEEKAAGLIPSNGTKVGCTGKTYYEIIRTRDLNSAGSCSFAPLLGPPFSIIRLTSLTSISPLRDMNLTWSNLINREASG